MSGDKASHPTSLPADNILPETKERATTNKAFGNHSAPEAATKLALDSFGIGDLAQLGPQQKTANARFYEAQQQQLNENSIAQINMAVGTNAPKEIKLAAELKFSGRQSEKAVKDALRANGIPNIKADELFAQLAGYMDFPQKDYYPPAQPARIPDNLPGLIAWEEQRLARIGRQLKAGVSLYTTNETAARVMVNSVVKEITWGDRNAPADIVLPDGSRDTRPYWEWVATKLSTLETAMAPNGRLFEPLQDALAADCAAQGASPIPVHAARDSFLGINPNGPPGLEQIVHRPQLPAAFNIEARQKAEEDIMARKRLQFGGANSVSAVATSVDKAVQALDNGDINAARQAIEDAKRANPQYVPWLNSALAPGRERESLRSKFDTLHEILETPAGQQSNPALQSLVTVDLLRIVEAKLKGDPISTTEAVFGEQVCRYIKDFHTMKAFHNAPLPAHKKNIERMIRAAERTMGAVNQAELTNLMSKIH